MENPLGNAWKYTQDRLETLFEFGVTIKNKETVYRLRDNGAGFDMANAQKLFAPFQRLHTASDFPGTGIGLATAQRIVQRHGGKIWAEGQTDKGATFFFTEVMQIDSAYQSDDDKRTDDHGQETHSSG
jgi:light-regulated signal transduction histidine kinase (bacteriophytochrome)